jgi:hypothetical protein
VNGRISCLLEFVLSIGIHLHICQILLLLTVLKGLTHNCVFLNVLSNELVN